MLGGALALSGADNGAVAAIAVPLKDDLGINNTQIGLLLSVVTLAGALCTLPVGLLTDRVSRTRLLALSSALWGVATFMSGFAPSYTWLLVSRAALGAVSATAGPTVASLIGDLVPNRERARMYGFILGGELVGTGLGLAVSGAVASALGWRFAFWWLAIPSGVLVWALSRLPEPERGGQVKPQPAGEAGTDAPRERGESPPEPVRGLAEQAAERAGVRPVGQRVLRDDPRQFSPWRAIRYVLRVPTNLVLIVASGLGYFFFSGMRAFAPLFATEHYGVSTALATQLVLVVGIGALAGVLVGGRVADRLMRRGRANARVLVPTVCLLAVPILLAPATLLTSLLVALPLLMGGLFLLGAVNPPLDAARLDIMHPYLWGTAEGVRTLLRTLCEAAAPTAFGYVSEHAFGGGGAALDRTLLLFLLPLIAAGLLGTLALRTYPRDVATADASARGIARRSDDSAP